MPPQPGAYAQQGAWGAAQPAPMPQPEIPPQPAVTEAPAAPAPEPEAVDDDDIFDTEALLAEIGADTDNDDDDVDTTPVVPDHDDDTLDALDDDDDDEDGGLSDEDLDSMFGDDEDIPAISSVVSADGEESTFDDPDEIPDPDDDDFPQSLTSDLNAEEDEAPQKKGGVLKWILIVFVVLLLAAGGAAVFLRDMVIGMVPELEPVYEMVGLAEDLGAGLDIRNVGSERVTEAGVDTLIVKGIVANISERDRAVPRIRVDLFDANGESVQGTVTDPVRIELPAGENAEFVARIEEPSPLARRLEVTFIERPESGNGQ